MFILDIFKYWRFNLIFKRYLYICLSVWKYLNNRLLIYLLRFNIKNIIFNLVLVVTQFALSISI